MSANSLAVKIARKLCENATDYFCQSFDGSVVENDFERLIRDVEGILVSSVLEQEKIVADNMENKVIEYVRNRIRQIDARYSRKSYRNKAKLQLLVEIAQKG